MLGTEDKVLELPRKIGLGPCLQGVSIPAKMDPTIKEQYGSLRQWNILDPRH